jgi:hypothetical protein
MPPDGNGAALKLRAEDEDDLAVLSACLQDALVSVRDLAYDSEGRIFVLIANRFRWEADARRANPGGPANERVLCGLAFRDVAGVSYRGFRRSDDERILSLLAIRPDDAAGDGVILLEFSGGAAIRIDAARIHCRAKDLGEPWPTSWRPRHDVGEPP